MPTEPDLTPEALEALQERLGGVEVPETMHGDNLAILLCSFFEDAEGEINDNGWTDAAIAGQDAVLTAIRAHYEPAFRTITALRAQLAKAEQHSEKSRALLDIAVAEYERRLATARADAAALINAVRDIDRDYETEYASRMYTVCTGCDAQLSEGRDHRRDCAWSVVDAALARIKDAAP